MSTVDRQPKVDERHSALESHTALPLCLYPLGVTAGAWHTTDPAPRLQLEPLNLNDPRVAPVFMVRRRAPLTGPPALR
ncbi:hypothetical protein GCM10017687_51220 [Streptomyces echinatus]